MASTDSNNEHALQEAGVQKMASPSGEGTRFIFPVIRHSFVMATIYWGFCAGVIVFMVGIGTPIIFPIGAGLLAMLIFIALAYSLFYGSMVDVSPRGIAVIGGPFGRGATRWIDAADIEKIDYKQSGAQDDFCYNLMVVRRSGKPVMIGKGIRGRSVVIHGNGKLVTIGKQIRGQQLAMAVIRQIEQAIQSK